MCLVTVSAFTENVMISEKDSSMFIEMNISLLVVLFCGEQNGGWGILSLKCCGGNASWAKCRGHGNMWFKIEQDWKKVQAQRPRSVIV